MKLEEGLSSKTIASHQREGKEPSEHSIKKIEEKSGRRVWKMLQHGVVNVIGSRSSNGAPSKGFRKLSVCKRNVVITAVIVWKHNRRILIFKFMC